MLQKDALGWSIMQSGKTRYSKKTNIAVFSSINFELISIKQASLNKQDLPTKIHFIND